MMLPIDKHYITLAGFEVQTRSIRPDLIANVENVVIPDPLP